MPEKEGVPNTARGYEEGRIKEEVSNDRCLPGRLGRMFTLSHVPAIRRKMVLVMGGERGLVGASPT